MPRYKLTIEYDGTNYAGWQRQDDQPTVQGELEAAVLKFCGQPAGIVGAGRTDSGVHATAQVAHVDLPRQDDPFRVMQGINFHLFNGLDESGKPTQVNTNRISVTKAQLVTEDFHARFTATRRHYLYRIINRRSRLSLETNRAWLITEKLDTDMMQKAADMLVGTHDFSSFRDTMCQAKSPIKTLEKLEIKRHGEEIRITTFARSFLHHQVRIMVGTLALIGKGRWTLQDMEKAIEAKDRKSGGPTSPPEGLYLTGVEY